jgi:hypothetical protein
MLRPILLLTLFALPGLAAAQCGRLLVSGYESNVHVYDACSGAFLQVLDQASPRRLAGAQATRVHAGMIYVVSENTQQILRYRADDLAYVDTFITAPAGTNPTGVAVGPDGDVYVGGYASQSVLRFDGGSGAAKGVAVAPRAAGLQGPDNGLRFGPDGRLYVPGYDSNNAVRWDPASNQTAIWVQPRAGGLRHSRAILFEAGGQTALIASEGSDAILRFRVGDGGFVARFAQPGFRPTGIDLGPDNQLFVTGDFFNGVRVLDARDGRFIKDLVQPGAGGLVGATFVTYLPPQATTAPTAQHVGSQFWVVGAGLRTGSTLDVADAVSANGAAFGSAFRAEAAVQRRWGSLRIRFTGCDSAELEWSSEGADSAGFGRGGYALERLAPNPASRACQSSGFANVGDGSYMSGAWFGGAARAGEGLFIDTLDAGQALVSFFTHRPAAAAR